MKDGLLWCGTDDGLLWRTRRRRRALGQRHAEGARPLVEDRHPRGLALRRGDRLRRGGPPPPGRLRPLHLQHARRRAGPGTPIAAGIPPGSYVNVVREDPEQRGLLYAGTETRRLRLLRRRRPLAAAAGEPPATLRARHRRPQRRPRHRDPRPRLLGPRRHRAPARADPDRRRLGRLALRPARGDPASTPPASRGLRFRRTSPPARTRPTARSSTIT